MRKHHFLMLFIFLSYLFACGPTKTERSVEKALESNDITEMKEIKNELSSKQHELAKQIDQLTKAISALDSGKRMPLITTYTVEPKTFNHFIEVQGSFSTKENILIFAEYSGILKEITVDEGQKVNKGQVLAKIDDGGLSEQLTQAEVQAELMKTTYERQKRLWEKNIGSEMQFLQAKANYEAQQKMVEQLKSQLQKTIIVAPFNGVVDEVITEEGNLVSPGQSGIMRIMNLDQMYVEAEVPENYILSVQKNKTVYVVIPVLADTLNAKISQAGNYINPANRSFKVEVKVENEKWDIKPNMNAKLRINDYSTDSALLIPQNIVSEDADGNKFIYVATDRNKNIAKAKKTFIALGIAQGDMVEITKGLEKGDVVINEGARTVLDGQKVEILN